MTIAHSLRFLKGTSYRKFLVKSELSHLFFQPGKILKIIEHVSYSIQSDIAKYYCLFIEGAGAFQMRGLY